MFVGKQNVRSNLEELLIRLRHADRLTQSSLLREICVVVSEDDEEALWLLLEYTTSVNGIEICSKLFGVLAVAITNNPAHWMRVATCPEVYDAACRVLSTGLAERTVKALGLLTLLLGGAEGCEERERGAAYAQGRVRSSGCLQAMSDLFFKVMYVETWKALCSCLAASCDGCEPNQTSCSHLLPACIEKCISPAAAGELLQLLQALVQGHTSNQRIFLQCNGIAIFTRRVLVRSEGSWLLKTLLEGSPETARLAFQASIPQTLTQLCTMHGRQSKVGQWCSVCLYHITAGLQKLTPSQEPIRNDSNLTFSNISEIDGNFAANVDDKNPKHTDFNSTTNHEVHDFTPNNINKQAEFRIKPSAYTYRLIPNIKNDQNFLEGRDTSNKNVSHKINKQAEESFRNEPSANTYRFIPNHENLLERGTFNKKSQPNTAIETLTENPFRNHIQEKPIQLLSSYSQTTKTLINTQTHKPRRMYQSCQDDKSCQTSFDDTAATKSVHTSRNTTNISEFQPRVSSTPHRQTNIGIRKLDYSNDTRKTKHIKRNTRQVDSSRVIPSSKLITKPKESKLNQSLGSKLLRSFSSTCDSVVQAFKGYFPKAQNTSTDSLDMEPQKARRSTSFADYMQRCKAFRLPNKRCKVLDCKTNEFNRESHSNMVHTKEMQNACETCNDTAVLQRKLHENQYLKDTVNTLKIGINLYGCNFKKIAKVYWQDDPYITSAVLYNLYRKLIVKKSSEN